MEFENMKKYLIIIGFIIVLTIILFIFIIINNDKDYRYDDYNYVTLKEEHDEYNNLTSRLAEINITSSDAKEVNNMLESRYEEALNNEDDIYYYNYSINKEYLSLVTFYIYIYNNNPKVDIETYNFDLKTNKLVSNEALLDEFNYTKDDIINTLKANLEDYYNKELESMYFTESECDFNCFLELRDITDYDSDIKLYVIDDKLVFYRSFNTYSKYGEEQFYRNEDFRFNLED